MAGMALSGWPDTSKGSIFPKLQVLLDTEGIDAWDQVR